jgi:hypothetical protein
VIKAGKQLVCGLMIGSAVLTSVRAEVILQYFNTSWNEIGARVPELAEAGYTAL